MDLEMLLDDLEIKTNIFMTLLEHNAKFNPKHKYASWASAPPCLVP
jgi:hypothetical protein